MKNALPFALLLTVVGCSTTPDKTPATAETVETQTPTLASQYDVDEDIIESSINSIIQANPTFGRHTMIPRGPFTRADSVRVRVLTGEDSAEAPLSDSERLITIGNVYEVDFHTQNKKGESVLENITLWFPIMALLPLLTSQSGRKQVNRSAVCSLSPSIHQLLLRRLLSLALRLFS